MVSVFIKLLLLVAVFQMVDCDFEGYETYHQDPYNSYHRKKDIQEIPSVGSDDPRVNLGRWKDRSAFLLNDLVKETGHTVYKISLFNEQIVIADPIAIRAMYDPKKVEKSKDWGVIKYNNVPLRGYDGSLTTNGQEHKTKKIGQYRIQKLALKRNGFDGMFKMLKKHYNSVLPAIQNDQVNVENLMDVVTLKTLTEFYLGKEYGDLKTYLYWFFSMFGQKGTKPASGQATIDLTDKIFGYLEETPYVKKDLPKIHKYDRRSLEVLKSEAVFFIFFFVVGGVRLAMNSAIPLFLNLDKKYRAEIVHEANEFMKDDDLYFEEKLKKLDVIDRFALEVFRYATPVQQSFGEAKKDFVLTSLHGNFQIRKGQFLQAANYVVQRNPDTFRAPEVFTTTGNQKHIKQNFFTFGGPYNQKPNPNNRKCLGQEVSLNMVKMFVVLFSRCDIVPVSDIKYTEKVASRRVASDEPLRVSKFECSK